MVRGSRSLRWLRFVSLFLALSSVLGFACKSADPGAGARGSAPAVTAAAANNARSDLPASSASAPVAAKEAPPSTPSADWARPFLWRIDGPTRGAAAKPSYLMGTIHIPDERLDPLLASVQRAFDASDVVVTEIPMDSLAQLKIAPMLMLPNGQTLDAVLAPKLSARLDAYLTQKGFPVAPLSHMKVWVIATQLVLLDHMQAFATMQPLDAILSADAKSAGKETAALETIEQQLGIFGDLSATEQQRMLEQTLDQMQGDAGDPTAEILAAYLAGDDAKLTAVMDAANDPRNPLDMKMKKRLITDRNVTMSASMVALLKANPGKSYFFAVGAAHTVGADGVAATLAKSGMTMTRLARD